MFYADVYLTFKTDKYFSFLDILRLGATNQPKDPRQSTEKEETKVCSPIRNIVGTNPEKNLIF